MSLTLRYMSVPDIQQVVSIDRVAFDPPWSARSYAYEITESTYSHMMVLESIPDAERPTNPWKRLMQNLSGGVPIDPQIVAYGGLWKVVDEAHISTVATHPDFRGRGWGEIVALLGMVRKSLSLGAAYVVLEVRISNTTAQNLYLKHGFVTHGIKKRYYHNNGEDAYDMRLDLLADDARENVEQKFSDAVQRHRFADHYTTATNPAVSTVE